jgi:hypothetical protein
MSDPNKISDKVTMISYYVNGQVYLYLLSEFFPEAEGDDISMFADEATMISAFFQAIRDVKATKIVSYNGFGFDIPYLCQRMMLAGLPAPNITQIDTFSSQYLKTPIKTPWGVESKWSFTTSGIDNIDLLPIFRKIYPDLPNHRLETVSQFLLGEGKVDVDIEEYQEAIKDPLEYHDFLQKFIEYSRTDSLLLHKLWNVLTDELYLICNTFLCMLTQIPDLKLHSGNLLLLRPASIGSYRNVLVYDLKTLIRPLVPLTEQFLFEKLPLGIWLNTTQQLGSINLRLKGLVDRGGFIEITSSQIKTTRPIDGAIPIQTYLVYVVPSVSSYLGVTQDHQVVTNGQSFLTKPQNKAQELYIHNWALRLVDPSIPPYVVEYTDPQLFIREVKLNPENQPELRERYQKLTGRTITTWVRVHTLRVKASRMVPIPNVEPIQYTLITSSEEKLYPLETSGDNFDVDYYMKAQQDLITKLKKWGA